MRKNKETMNYGFTITFQLAAHSECEMSLNSAVC